MLWSGLLSAGKYDGFGVETSLGTSVYGPPMQQSKKHKQNSAYKRALVISMRVKPLLWTWFSSSYHTFTRKSFLSASSEPLYECSSFWLRKKSHTPLSTWMASIVLESAIQETNHYALDKHFQNLFSYIVDRTIHSEQMGPDQHIVTYPMYPGGPSCSTGGQRSPLDKLLPSGSVLSKLFELFSG